MTGRAGMTGRGADLVGIVVVSHSRALADAAVELAGQMVHDDGPRVAVAAGMDDGSLGTDATAIAAAIERVDGPAGVVVLMDLGSAVLSAELALDLADDPDLRDRVVLSPAPLVEGLVAAVVTAAGGAPAADVAAEAAGALAAKQSQLGALAPGAPLDETAPAAPAPRAPLDETAPAAPTPGAPLDEPAPAAPTPGAPLDETAPAAPTPGARLDETAPAAPAPGARLDEPAPAAPAPGARLDEPAPDASAEVTVTPEHGLHARPVARLAGVLRGLDARVTVSDLTSGTGPAPATSPTRVALLGALRGHRLRFDAAGPDAEEAVRRLVALADRAFDDPAPGPAPSSPAPSSTYADIRRGSGVPDDDDAHTCGMGGVEGSGVGESGLGGSGVELSGVGASPGAAVGPVRHLRVRAPDPADAPPPSGDPEAEEAALREAVAAARAGIAAVRDATASDVGESEAAVFDAHLGLLADDALLGDAHDRVRAGDGAVRGWAAAVDGVHTQLAALPDPYLAARAADVRAVGDAVLRALLGTPAAAVDADGVLVAEDLTPEQAAGLDAGAVRAVVLARGSTTSHAAILTRARGIPAVVGAGDGVLALPEGTLVAVDGSAGTLVVRPDDDQVAAHEARRAERRQRLAAARVAAAAPARTLDGTLVPVACNVGSVADARAGGASGAEGAGLVRTELCFVGRPDEPDVDEQEALYLEVARALGGRRVTLRTLDVGGDKPLPYLPVPHEANPFLGLRGLRLGLAREPVLRRQLTAVVRVARQTPVSVMFPMVSAVDELRRARALLDDVLAAEAGGAVDGLRVGIMVEVPATALKLDAFAGLLDFVSIGTNDLTQYALAAERGNPHVAALSDPLDPGVLALVAACCRAAGTAPGTPAPGRFEVAVCGEAASDEVAVPVLLGLGVGELSVAPQAVPSVKQGVRGLDLEVCAGLARSALAAASAEQVRDLVRERLGG